ncbi:MAG: iron-containing alcohol dehydrogenase, partial [Alphaproteobacteria bacterium]
LGAVYDKHHGLLNAILLPYVMIRNRDAISSKMELLSRFLNLPGNNGFDAVLDWVMRIRESLGIPHSLSEIDIKTGDAEKIGKMALADLSSGGNPLPLTAKDYAALFDAARRGDLDSAKIAA